MLCTITVTQSVQIIPSDSEGRPHFPAHILILQGVTLSDCRASFTLASITLKKCCPHLCAVRKRGEKMIKFDNSDAKYVTFRRRTQ